MYINNFDEIKDRFISWWSGDLTEGPLVHIVAERETPKDKLNSFHMPKDPKEYFTSAELRVAEYDNFCKIHDFYGDAFPNLKISLGPGSMAIYIGSNPVFSKDTIWYEEIFKEASDYKPLIYDENNYWWKLHQNIAKKAVQLAGDRFQITIPDIIENIDIYSSLRGAQNTCFDIMLEPDTVKNALSDIDNLYFKYYDKFYNILKDKDNGTGYAGFKIWGPGKTAKVQCDFSAMLSPAQFDEFILPSLKNQINKIDFSLYHLDGVDATRHIDSVLTMENLNAVQWSPGAGNEDGLNERWYPLYDKIIEHEKSLWVLIEPDGGVNRWKKEIASLLKRYGSSKIYLVFEKPMRHEEAEEMMRFFKQYRKL